MHQLDKVLHGQIKKETLPPIFWQIHHSLFIFYFSNGNKDYFEMAQIHGNPEIAKLWIPLFCKIINFLYELQL